MNIENILNSEIIPQLIDSLQNGKDFSYKGEGLDVRAKVGEGYQYITIGYTSDDELELAEKERGSFRTYLESLEDNLFIDFTEWMGQDNIHKITESLNSNKLESVRSGIAKFNSLFKDFLNGKIDYYKKCLNKLLK